ncbi:MAG: hypothetical protein RIQ72_594 [Candidatus Parcubacteria bacterium]|jgi:uncharacterized membrane protein YfcA
MNDILVVLLGFASGFLGSIGGGAGLIVLPVLLFAGIPPQIALGSFNMGGLGYILGNFVQFSQSKNIGITKKEISILTCIAIPATVLGSYFVISISPEFLSKLIGVILLIIFPLTFLNKNLGIKPDKATGLRLYVSHIAFFLIRVWAGFFSPGSGILEGYIRMKGYGYTILQGKAVTRIPYILAGLASVSVFALSNMIDYHLASALFIGMFLGGYIGTAYAIKKGDIWLKPILGLVILATAIQMLFFS